MHYSVVQWARARKPCGEADVVYSYDHRDLPGRTSCEQLSAN
jgi:hypothetical protein